MIARHNLHSRKTIREAGGARLHLGPGESLELGLDDGETATLLATGATIKLCLKPKDARDTDRLVYITLAVSDLHANSGTYRKVFNTLTEPFETLLGVNESTTDDVTETTVHATFIHFPASGPEEIGDTFEIVFENTPYRSTDASPTVTDNPDDEWAAHGHAQSLTDPQKVQALANIGAPADASVVKLSGNQSIDGVKTFTSSPVVPDATTSGQAASKGQMDTALALKAPLDSPAFTNTPTAPTAAPGTNTTQLATTAFVLAVRDALINSAPGVLDTLDEIAAALGDDENFAASVSTALAARLIAANNLSDLTNLATALVNLGLAPTDRPTWANVRLGHSVLTYGGSVVLDFDGDGFQTVTLTGVVAFTTSNLAACRSKTLRVIGDTVDRAFTFPAGWKFVGAAEPAAMTADKVGVLTLTSFGTTDADVIAAFALEA